MKNKGFSLVEVILGIFLLGTVILIITGVIISALQATRKSEALLEATNIMVGEKGKIDSKGYNEITKGDSYVIKSYYIIYSVENYDYPGGVSDEMKVIRLTVSNAPEDKVSSFPKDKLILLQTSTVLYYKNNNRYRKL